MKKIIYFFIFFFLFFASTAFSDDLGYGIKKAELNLQCKLDEKMFTDQVMEQYKIPKSFLTYNFGYLTYDHPDEKVLLYLPFNDKRNEYLGPYSLAIKRKSNESSARWVFETAYSIGTNMLQHVMLINYKDERFQAFKSFYSIDDQTAVKFKKDWDKSKNISNDPKNNNEVVKILSDLTKDHMNYFFENQANQVLVRLLYNCELSN